MVDAGSAKGRMATDHFFKNDGVDELTVFFCIGSGLSFIKYGWYPFDDFIFCYFRKNFKKQYKIKPLFVKFCRTWEADKSGRCIKIVISERKLLLFK